MIGEILTIAAGSLLILVALVGCVVPVVPGPLLAAAALYLVSVVGEWTIYTWPVLALWTVLAVAAQLSDNILPARAAGKAGAGKAGVFGSVVGMVAGTLFFPPFGVFIGAFGGAFLGELVFHRENREPLKAAVAVFRGSLGAIVVKLAVSGGIAVVFIRGAVRLV